MEKGKIKYRLMGAYVELTTECNLRCLHCYNESGKEKAKIDEVDLENICQSLKKAKQDHITFSGGEPFLHPKILDYINICTKQGIGVSIISNATQITQQLLEQLPRENISFQISLNGSKQEIHDALCGKGRYEKTMKGISNLKKYFPNEIQIHCVVNQYNQYDLKNIIELLREQELMEVSFSELNETGRTKKNEEKISLTHTEVCELVAQLQQDEEIKKWEKEGMKITYPETSMGCPFMDEEEIGVASRIDPYGNVYLCQSLEAYSIGSIKEDILYDIIYKNEKIDHAIRMIQKLRNEIKECEQCVWQVVCGRGCPATSFMKYHSLSKTDGECRERSILFLQDLKNNLAYN